MNHENRPAFLIVSVDRFDATSPTNVRNRVRFEAQARYLGLRYKRVAGYFEGVREESYVVVPRPGSSDLDAVYNLARGYRQSAILYVNEDRIAWRLDVWPASNVQTGTDALPFMTRLGAWTSAGTARPHDESGWTYDPTTGGYWTIRSSGQGRATVPLNYRQAV